MNRTKIEWTDYSWNPITGCLYDCWYCYAKKLFTRFHRSFEPTFHPERLEEPAKLKKPSKIFCCSVSDLFAYWTKEEWREAVIGAIAKYPQHTFQLLTKQPQGIEFFRKPDNIWCGVTVTCQQDVDNNMIRHLRKRTNAKVKFVSFEPLLGEIGCDLRGIDWVIIGKLTGSRAVKLQKEWVENLIKNAEHHDVPVFIKDNLSWHKKVQEFPEVKK